MIGTITFESATAWGLVLTVSWVLFRACHDVLHMVRSFELSTEVSSLAFILYLQNPCLLNWQASRSISCIVSEIFRVFWELRSLVEKRRAANLPFQRFKINCWSLFASNCRFRPCTALNCFALHLCTALHCIARHCTALHCTALHCAALHCTTSLCTRAYLETHKCHSIAPRTAT